MPLPRFAKIYGFSHLAGIQLLHVPSKASILLATFNSNYPYNRLLRQPTVRGYSLTFTKHHGRKIGQHDGRIADTEEAMSITNATRCLNVQLSHIMQTRNA
jgi:hypothetical protein